MIIPCQVLNIFPIFKGSDNMGCIYKITNVINNKLYIGYTTATLKERMRRHKNDDINHNTLLGRAIKKYGWENFKYEVVVYEDDKEKLLELE